MDTFDWQTPAALTVVVLTALAFLVRAIRKRRRPKSCAGSSGASLKRR